MTEIEQAVDELVKYDINLGGSDISFETARLARIALREKAEREKGCEYCLGEKRYGIVSFPEPRDGKVKLRDVEAIEANLCPMCGRRLTEKEAQG